MYKLLIIVLYSNTTGVSMSQTIVGFSYSHERTQAIQDIQNRRSPLVTIECVEL